MKTFIIALLVMAVMLSGFGVYTHYLTNTANEITSIINNVSDAAKGEDWDTCNQKVDDLMDFWSRHEKILCSFTDHGDLDTIKTSMNELKESARYEDPQETVMYASVLLVLIDRLTENEMPTLENILQTYTETTLNA